MKIVHFSDWHWNFQKLPKADLYVCTGDMLPNFPVRDTGIRKGYTINPENEAKKQTEILNYWIKNTGGFANLVYSTDIPIVCVRGNHDFIDLKHMFSGCNFVHEFIDNEQIDIHGFKLTGHRGIPFIENRWSDETNRNDLFDKAFKMQASDIFITHYGPKNILDSEIEETYSRNRTYHYGLDGLSDLLENKRINDVAAHLFGHVHESYGMVFKGPGSLIGGSGWQIVYSNAAGGINEIELEKL